MANQNLGKSGNLIRIEFAIAICAFAMSVPSSVLAAGGKNLTWISCDLSFESRNSPGKEKRGVSVFVIDKSKPDVYLYDSKLSTITSVSEPEFGRYCDQKTDAVRVSESKIIWNSSSNCKDRTTGTESNVIDRASLKYQKRFKGSDGDWAEWDGVCEIIQPKLFQENKF